MGGGSAKPVEPPLVYVKRCAKCLQSKPRDHEHWYYYQGKPVGWCKICRAAYQTKHQSRPHGYVPADKVVALMKELVDRCGTQEEAFKFSGIARNTISGVMSRKTKRVQKQTVRLLVLALHERRKQDRRNGSSARFLAARQHQAQLEERMNRLAGY